MALICYVVAIAAICTILTVYEFRTALSESRSIICRFKQSNQERKTMKKLNVIGGVLLAMTIVLGSAQVAMSDTAMSVKGGDRPSANPSERYLKVLAEVSYISTLTTTNCYAFMDYMTDSAKSSARAFSRKMLLDDKQYFLPDFCKVK